MARIKNVSGRDLIVPALGGRLVVDGAIVEVPDEETYGFTCQEPNWQPTDAAAKKATEAGAKAEAAATEPQPEPEPASDESSTASKENS